MKYLFLRFEVPKKENTEEIRINCLSDSKKIEIVDNVKKVFEKIQNLELMTIDGVKAKTEYGWGLLRASNTQPVISLRFESTTKEGLLKIKQDFCDVLKNHFDEKILKNQIGI